VTHLHHSSHFTPDALPAATLPLHPGFGQAPNMLACIPSGMVSGFYAKMVEITLGLTFKG